jgi:hypothetical protein
MANTSGLRDVGKARHCSSRNHRQESIITFRERLGNIKIPEMASRFYCGCVSSHARGDHSKTFLYEYARAYDWVCSPHIPIRKGATLMTTVGPQVLSCHGDIGTVEREV